MTLVIISPCIDVKEGICTTSCPVDCIYVGERMYYIHPTECIECGMCESICPVDAIRYDDEGPEEELAFVALNEDAFRLENGEIAYIGGWRKTDPPLKDPETLTELSKGKEEQDV